jgi:outer membrane immunogenic protein
MFNPIRSLTVLGKNMHKFFLRLALVSVAFIPAASALAADLDMEVVPPPPPPIEELRPATYDWTGGYVGALVGSSCIDGSLVDNDLGGAPPAPVQWEMSGCGFKGGVLVGYNHQFDNWVIGMEADWSKTNDVVENTDPGADFTFGLNHEVTMRGRVGYAADDTLFFLTGGAAWAQGNLDGIIAAAPDNIKGKHLGWTIGGGVEHAFTDQFRLKLDYLYTQYKGETYSAACCNVDIKDFSNHEVRLGAIWAF